MIGKINPENQIQLNFKTIIRLLNFYDLIPVDFKEIKTGVENTSIFLKTNKGKFVLRVYRRNNKTMGEIAQEVEFMNFLRNQGIPTPQIMLNLKGKLISQIKINKVAWNFILMEFVDGKHLISDQHSIIAEVSKYQALIHKAAGKFKKVEKSKNLKDRINEFTVQNKKAEKFLKNNYLWPDIRKIIIQTAQDAKRNFDEINSLPSGLVHLDYDSDNILTKRNKVMAILDFDDLSCQPFIMDLGNSLWWWLFTNKNNDLKLLYKKYLGGYQKYRRLSKKELLFLLLFIKMRNISIAIFDINHDEKKSLKEWKKVLDFDEAVNNLANEKI